MSDSVHLVVDETPGETTSAVEPPAIISDKTTKTVDSQSDENKQEPPIVACKKTPPQASVLSAAIPSAIAVINVKETATGDKNNKTAENAENLSTKADKVATELAKEISPIKPKSVLNIVTDNIEPVQVLNDIKANVLSELMNESSNTNYSMED